MITHVKDNYESPLVLHLRADKQIVPLVGCNVIFTMISKATSQIVGGGECLILDPASGIVKYTFKPGELSQVGDYQIKAHVELDQGVRREGIALDFKVVEKP